MQAFGRALRKEISSEGHSQAQAARLAGISQPAVSAYLSGRRQPDLKAFARLLRVYPRLITWIVEFAKRLS